MATGELTCCYCGRTLNNNRSKSAHEPKCIHGPVMSAAIRNLMYEHAVDGVGLSSRSYDQVREDLPSAEKIAEQAGSWSGYLLSIGLKVPKTVPPKYHYKAALITQVKQPEEQRHLLPHRDFSALAVMHDWKERTRKYGMRVYHEMYTVLR